MKTTAKLATVVLGALFVLTMFGCAKKCVTPTESVATPPPPETLNVKPPTPPAPPKVELNLAAIHFDFDKSDVRPGDATILQSNYDLLQKAIAAKQKPMVTIEGYCDPIGTAAYNMALGMRRAEAAKAYLVKLGADLNMFSTISYGQEKLVTQDKAKYELNRRCEFKPAQ
ncbi:MAG TPA: OmpA family protein [bacterium]|nr:OmpA family protein [bacterium]